MGSYYTLEGMSLALSIYNFPDDYSKRPYIKTKALRYIFTHRKKYGYKAPSLKQLLHFSNTLFDQFHRQNDIDSMREVADIVHQYIPTSNFLDRIRQLENEEIPTITHVAETRISPKQTKTVYADSQNVHNTKINQSVIKILTHLYNKYKDIIDIPHINHKSSLISTISDFLTSKYPLKKDLILHFIKYIKESTANFSNQNLSMIDAFLSLWLWIKDNKDKEELELRLLEEMKEMKGHCTTGHLARLMNVIQGFTDDENLSIRISDKEQCTSVVKQYLTSDCFIQNAQDCTCDF